MSDKTKKILGIAGGVAVLICVALLNSAAASQHPAVHQTVEIILQVLAGLGFSAPVSIMAAKSATPSLADQAEKKAANQ